MWDVYKADKRGTLIKLSSEQRKSREKKVKEIQEMIKIKEQDQLKKPKEKMIADELKLLRKQFENMLMEEVNRNIKFMQQKYFESADKPRKLLAWQLKERRKKVIISKFRVNGREVTQQNEIKDGFVRFYTKLYGKLC